MLDKFQGEENTDKTGTKEHEASSRAIELVPKDEEDGSGVGDKAKNNKHRANQFVKKATASEMKFVYISCVLVGSSLTGC